jgi:hypothetical protein
MAAHDWATWKPTIGPRQPLYNHAAMSTYGLKTQLPTYPATLSTISSYDLPHGCTECHVVVRTTTWCNFTGPRNNLEMQNMSDTLKPCHNAKVSMTHVSSCTCHVCCMDADVNNIDANSSPC